eukprot:Nitzschia sp. Nitz4//scaffold169_size48518//10376//10894//NITZ4_007065-RA/size48518-processed-gene-0.88-mRNA-1//-1//CDS//3329538367//3870//frame0
MSSSQVLTEVEEYEEYYEDYEEELLSECEGLSTIQEVDEEDEEESSVGGAKQRSRRDPLKSSSNHSIPDNISLSHGSLKSFHLVSPTMFSPMAQARKKLSVHSPLGSKAAAGLVLTNLMTGEELLVSDDDDEFTFVSCSDTDSFLGASVATRESERAALDGSNSSIHIVLDE